MPLGEPPFIHPEDMPEMQRLAAKQVAVPAANFRQFLSSQRFGDFKDHRFHFSLLPIPYLGDLDRADIFLLQLNPGFDLVNYHAEWNVPAFRRRVVRNLRQEVEGIEFPLHSLDPEFCWYTGYQWWEGKLRDVATIIASKKYNGRYFDALRELSQRIAVIELVPYHSIAFNGNRLIRVLPSIAQARNLVRNLRERAASGAVLIIAMRQVAEWGFAGTEEFPGVVLYPTPQARSSSLGSDSIGGRAILKRFDIDL